MLSMLWLFVLAFIALPLLATIPSWSQGRAGHAALWVLLCVAIPAVVFVTCLKIIQPGGDGSPGDGLGVLFVSGLVAAVVWLGLNLAAFFSAAGKR